MLLESLRDLYLAHPNLVYAFVGFVILKVLADCTKRDDSGVHSAFGFAEFIFGVWFIIEFALVVDGGML